MGRRRYFRLHLSDASTAIGVVYPAEEDGSRRRWVAAHRLLGGAVRVPALIADDGIGNQIEEDLGHEDLAARCAATPAERAAHDAWAAALVREILEHPAALCHRDFHGNNLFPVGAEVAVIDFQDLRRGPDSYDLASLLWERTTLDWMDEAQADAVISRFATRRGLEPLAFAARLERVLLQRAWKVCGTFARAVALGKGDAYRRYLPGELTLVGRLLSDGPEDRSFAAVLASRSLLSS